MGNIRLVVLICASLSLGTAFLGNGQSRSEAGDAHVLFSQTVRTSDRSLQSEVLGNAEHRMRIVQLLPFGDVGKIDLSGKLFVQLFDDVSVTVQLKRERRSALHNIEVWKGRVPDSRFDHLPQYLNTVFTVNTATGRMVANIETEQGFFQVLPTEKEGEYRIRDCKRFEDSFCQYMEGDALRSRIDGTSGRAICGSPCYDEMDESGLYVIDVFAGYSDEAAAVAGDLEAHAQANIETVNMGLGNSMIGLTYLRLVGTGTTPNNPGIVTSVLSDAWTWFAPQIEALAPDFLAIFQTPTDAPGSAGGWGYMPGRISVNGVEWGTVFRHEFGHNVGGAHCYPDNQSHLNGYNHGN